MRRGTRGQDRERMEIRIPKGTVTAPGDIAASGKETGQLMGRLQGLVMPPNGCGYACFVSQIIIVSYLEKYACSIYSI